VEKFCDLTFAGLTFTRAVGKEFSHFEYLENRSCGLDVIWQPEETLCICEHSLSRGASQSAVRRRCLSLCTVWLSHSQWPSEQISFITTMRLPILQLSCRIFLKIITSARSVSPPYSPDWSPCGFGFSLKLKSPLKGRRLVNATVTHSTQAQLTASHCRLTSPTGRVTVHGCKVRSPLTGCHFTPKPRDRFSRYSKWLDTFRTALLIYHDINLGPR